MTEAYAYIFKSDLSLPQVLSRLQEISPWSWIDRENDRWGDYISAGALPDPDYGIVKIIEDEGRYVINVVLESERADGASSFAEVRDAIFKHLLPALGAREIATTDLYE